MRYDDIITSNNTRLLIMKICTIYLLLFSYVFTSLLQAEDIALKKPSEIFKDCAKCHGKDGKHRPFNRSGPLAGREAADLVASMMPYKNDEIKGKGVTLVMAKRIKRLNQKEIENLAIYISKL